jgi:hypothetical protein
MTIQKSVKFAMQINGEFPVELCQIAKHDGRQQW